jgi:60 kDa SS-A/Ro ribonucleoprotein
LNTPEVWEALLEKMPMTALIRNLGNMSKVKLINPGSKAEKLIVAKLTDQKALHAARIHPIALLSALRVYAYGTAFKGASTMYGAPNQDWIPAPRVIDALDTAFELAFQNIEPSNKRTMLALDVSGSMGMGMVAGVAGLTPREASAAMALVTARSEPAYSVLGFSDRLTPLDISAKMRLDDVIARISNLPFDATDCALPMLHAMKTKQEVDTFVIYTDSETWFGKVHPSQALKQYREWSGIPARLIVVGMLGNRFSIADPDDAGMLDVIGFDAAAPALMAQFARGEV